MTEKIYQVIRPGFQMSFLWGASVWALSAFLAAVVAYGQVPTEKISPAVSDSHLKLQADTVAAIQSEVHGSANTAGYPTSITGAKAPVTSRLGLANFVVSDEDESTTPQRLPTINRLLELTNSGANARQAEVQTRSGKDDSRPEIANESSQKDKKSQSPRENGLRLTDATGEQPVDDSEADAGDLAALPPEDQIDERTSECPGAPSQEDIPQEPGPDDVPLEQTEHPYDAPAAESEEVEDHSSSSERLTDVERTRRDRINECLKYFIDHPENVVRRGPWALMHATLPFGVEAEIIAGNRRVTAIGWMCFNGVCAKQRMFQPTNSGFRTNVGPGVQGHEGQFLAILAQSKVQRNYPIRIGTRQYTIEDLIRYEMATCRENSELTFKLIGLSYYLDQDQRWRDNRGRYWNLEKMVGEELSQPINGAACGGSHRLMGLSYAVIRRQLAGQPLTGSWLRAEDYLNKYVNYTMTLQNPDGSFSTEWFERRGQDPDVERRVQTTGHILEWLIYTLPDEHLKSPRIVKSVDYLLDTVGRNPSRDWPIGPRGHVLRALALYNQRVFGAEPGKMKTFIASTESERARR